MWHNPRLLNLAANALLGLAALIFAYAALQLLLRSPLFPLREIVVRGELKHASAAEVENAVDGVGGNFFAVDLAALRARLEQVGWVRRVELRRVWPDRVELRVEEHVALARWSDTGLINTHGEPFAAAIDESAAARLPHFDGPAGTEAEVTRRYRRFSEELAPLGRTLERVLLSPRHAWRLHLDGGLQLELGRDGPEPVESRLTRFVAAFPDTLGKLGRRQGQVDLRYPHGFALRVAGWKG